MLTLKFFFYSVRITEREREKKKIGGNPGNLTKTQDHKGPKKKKKKNQGAFIFNMSKCSAIAVKLEKINDGLSPSV